MSLVNESLSLCKSKLSPNAMLGRRGEESRADEEETLEDHPRLRHRRGILIFENSRPGKPMYAFLQLSLSRNIKRPE